MSDALIDGLRQLLGARQVLTAADDVRGYATDWRGRYSATPLCVARPGNADEVSGVVKLCAAAGVAMVPQGGNTGLCGGATPRGGEVLISLGRMNRIRALDLDNRTVSVDAGCTLQAVQEAAAAEGLLFPLSLAAEGTATIGGNLSTNAGGVQVLRFGMARAQVLGIEVVLPDGRMWNGLRGLRKDNSGYDVKQWFIGAEGTLGLITGAVLGLHQQPASTLTAWIAIPDPKAAVGLLSELRRVFGDCICAYELMGQNALGPVFRHLPGLRNPLPDAGGWRVLLEMTDSRATDLETPLLDTLSGLESGLVLDAAVAKNAGEATNLWALREGIPEAEKKEGIAVKHDIAVPVSRIAEFIARADAAVAGDFPASRVVCFGHVGDGNLHYNIFIPGASANEKFLAASSKVNRLVYDLVHELGGSISAEHGLGQLKREEILRYKSAVEIDLMRAMKKALDPRGLMNPGKVV